MPKGILRLLCCISYALLTFSHDAFAQGETPPSVDSLTLEQIPDRLRDADKLVFDKTNELLALVASELTAKRISEPAARELRLVLAAISPPIKEEIAALHRPSLVPSDDEPLSKALLALKTAWELCKSQREALINHGVEENAKRTSDISRTARCAADVSPLIAAVERFVEAASKRIKPVAAKIGPTHLDEPLEFLYHLQKTFETWYLQNPEKLSGLVLALKREGKENAAKRIAEIVDPVNAAYASANAALDTAILDQKPEAIISSALKTYQNTKDQFEWFDRLVEHSAKETSEMIESPRIYENLTYSVIAIEQHKWLWARQYIANAREKIFLLGAKREPVFTEFLMKLDREVTDGTGADERGKVNEMRERLNGVKLAVELEVIADKLSDEERFAEKDDAPFFFKGLGILLGGLADDWRSLNPVSPLTRQLNQGAGAFSTEIETLRQKIIRDLLSQLLRAPELKQAPMADQPLDAALDSLCKKLASEGAWQRLLEMLKAREWSGLLSAEKGLANKDAIHSIKAFLAGQNFELAEEWADAADAYEAAIQTKADGAPIKEASERMKILEKEHPEAFSPITNASRPPNSK